MAIRLVLFFVLVPYVMNRFLSTYSTLLLQKLSGLLLRVDWSGLLNGSQKDIELQMTKLTHE
jgi:hypothetical protein